MMNYPVNQYLAAHHRNELLNEAEHERLAQAATACATSSARRMLSGFSRQLLTRTWHAAHHSVIAPNVASPA